MFEKAMTEQMYLTKKLDQLLALEIKVQRPVLEIDPYSDDVNFPDENKTAAQETDQSTNLAFEGEICNISTAKQRQMSSTTRHNKKPFKKKQLS